MTSIAILGANGRLGRTVAKAFIKAGYDVTAITRGHKPIDDLKGAKFVTADASKPDELIAATRGMDIIFNGLNPLYTEWEEKCRQLAHSVMAACKANGSLHLFPGNVYNYGSPMPLELSEETPHRPSTSKGRIREEMEAMFAAEANQAGGVRTIILRAGDFFGGTGKETWFDLMMISKVSKGTFTAPGNENIIHAWAYLPDLAETFVALATVADQLEPFTDLNFPGHAATALDFKKSVEKQIGRPLKLAHLPWWLLRLTGPFKPMFREFVKMSYLNFEPHRLVSKRLAGLIGTVPHTSLDEAVKQALIDQGLSWEALKRAA